MKFKLPSTLSRGAWIAIAVAFAGSMWLRQAFPINALGFSSHDDLLFVRLAESLRAGKWLGDYDNLTLSKGAAYSFFIAFNQVIGLPLKVAEHLLYLFSALYFSIVVGSHWQFRAATPVLFAVLAFNPVFWAPEIGGRVVRENLYISLTVLLIALCVRVFVAHPAVSVPEELRGRRRTLAALGIVGALFWLTREEGAWIVPSVLLLSTYWIVERGRRLGWPLRSMLVFLLRPILFFVAVVGAVDALNFAKYGVFRNNDFRSHDFQSAYGALARIRHDNWVPYVVFPADARERAYAVSAAARELKPYFEGEGGINWRKISCEQTKRDQCPEILSGWFMWALRQSVTAAGHYKNARETRAFYERLAEEVNAACDRGQIPCGPRHDSLIPPWQPTYFGATLAAARIILPTVAALGDPQVYISPSIGNEDQFAHFRKMTRGRLATEADTASTDVRVPLAKAIAHAEIRVSSFALPASILVWLVLLVGAVARKRWHPGHVIVAGLVTAVAMRMLLLSFLDATSIPSNNALYPSPVVPFVMALVPCVLFLIFDQSAIVSPRNVR